MIKYHQNGLGNEYGEDHRLTNNWNPDVDYKNEYSNVYFRIEAEKYQFPSFSFTGEENREFYNEVKASLLPLGWHIEHDSGVWDCTYIVKGKSKLYLHPQNFSGEVLKKEIKSIAEALEKHNTFYLRWVELYDTVYDISNNEYDEYLETKREDIRKALFENCQTKRINKYYYCFDVCSHLAEKFRLRRLDMNDGRNGGNGQTLEFIQKVIDAMITDGLLKGVEIEEYKHVRSLNKTEQKKLKICSVA